MLPRVASATKARLAFSPARFASTFAQVKESLKAKDFGTASTSVLELTRRDLDKESQRELPQTQMEIVRSFMNMPKESLADELPTLWKLHKKFLELGSVTKSATTSVMLLCIQTGQPERAIEIWVQYLEALGSRTNKPISEIISLPNHIPCSLTALSAYFLSVASRGTPVDPETALKLVPLKQIPVSLRAAFDKRTSPISKEQLNIVKDGLQSLRGHTTDFSSEEYANLVRKARRDEVLVLYKEAEARGNLSEQTYALFIRRFAETNQITVAFKLWNSMIEQGITPTIASWSSLLRVASLSQTHPLRSVKELWSKMVADGITPSSDAYATRFIAMTRNGETQQALNEFRDLQEKSPELVDMYLTNTIIDAHLRKREFADAEKVLTWAQEHGLTPTNVTFNSFIRSAVDGRRADLAAHYLGMMKAAKISPDIITYSHVLDVLLKSAKHRNMDITSAVESILDDMKKYRISPNPHFYTILADGIYKLEQDVNLSRRLFKTMQARHFGLNVETFGSVIESEIKYGDFKQALHYFTLMPQYGLPRKTSNYNQILKGARTSNEIEFAKGMFENMLVSAGAVPNKYTYMTLLDKWDSSALENGAVQDLIKTVFTALNKSPENMDYPIAKRVQAISETVETEPELLEKAAAVIDRDFNPHVARK